MTLWPNRLQAQGAGFNNIIPFSTNAGRVGFFDQASGKVYIYDNNLSECVFIGQLSSLGGSIQKISGNTPSINATGSLY